MNDFNVADGNNPISQKFKEVLIRIIRSVFDLKNFVKLFELMLLLVFTVLYGKQPVFKW
jgi:hypothetical protein